MTCIHRNRLSVIVAAVGLAAFAQYAEGASITFLGSDETSATQWRTTTLAKAPAFDPDGDNAYGTDGYYALPASATLQSSLPAYIGSVNDNGGRFNASVYPEFDDPTEAIGPAVPNVDAGIFFADTSGSFSILDFTLAQDEEFVLTIPLVGDQSSHRPSALSLEQIAGGGASASAMVPTPAGGDDVNYLFFNVDGSAGDAFEIVIDGSSTIHGIGGVAFEAQPAPVPEPASLAMWSLIGAALAALGYYRVRRKR